jgi:beta-lactamase superfamily II metal-dependent hydrolase
MCKKIFTIEMLPALHGDCLFIEYGDASHPRRILIDGGPIGAYSALEQRINKMPDGDKRFELMVLTHVDTDHADGLIRLFANRPLPFVVNDVWFNGWKHLSPNPGLLGGIQGEFISALIAKRLKPSQWNGAFTGKPVVVPEEGDLPQRTLADGMVLTLLSPTPGKLENFRKKWKDALKDGMTPGNLDAALKSLEKQKKYLPGQGLLGDSPELQKILDKQLKVDDSAANATSIAFLAEWGEKSCLFLGDAHADVIIASLNRLLAQRGQERLKVDAVKVAHHGSAGNINSELVHLIDSRRFLITTNGAQFKHPDKDAIDAIISGSFSERPTLFFNYRSNYTEPWLRADKQTKYNYKAVCDPDADAPSLVEL